MEQGFTGTCRHVLIVEDNPDLRCLYRRAMTRAGFKTTEAGNGREALDALANSEERPDVIVLDLMMPVMDGWGFLKERAKDPSLAALPVVVCSAAEKLPDDVHSLQKPVDTAELIDVLGQYCSRAVSV